ncbi:MAG: RdgB/HAM1 family non-canonical purine NTP pyrophosphatase [Coriobacteriia bacterium]|nr:RdgB/HAM1 family non-canonical purine NTP pyrophosphatase [Coriobacteriia bacterium]
MMSTSSDAPPLRRVVVATGNAHKVEEIAAALSDAGYEFIAATDVGDWPEPDETGETFIDNARIKAHAARELYGLPVLADDSGLEVDPLDGEPGVYSARYAGPCATDAENNSRLLLALAGIPADQRTARFRSVLVFLAEDGSEVVAEGTCEGIIGDAPRGEGGFGYDPLFLPDATPGRAMAELSMAEKNAISHRGAALTVLHAKLTDTTE